MSTYTVRIIIIAERSMVGQGFLTRIEHRLAAAYRWDLKQDFGLLWPNPRRVLISSEPENTHPLGSLMELHGLLVGAPDMQRI